MQADEAEGKYEQKIRYSASCYVSKQYREIIFSIMQVEFVDQLCEHEPVVALDIETSAEVVGSTCKAILADSNVNNAANNPLLNNKLSDILQGRIFLTRNDYAKNQLLVHEKQTHFGNVYYDTPGYQSSRAQTIKDFDKYYLHFGVDATDETIFIRTFFNEWNPVHLSKEVPLNIDNEALGVLLLGFSKVCLIKSA